MTQTVSPHPSTNERTATLYADHANVSFTYTVDEKEHFQAVTSWKLLQDLQNNLNLDEKSLLLSCLDEFLSYTHPELRGEVGSPILNTLEMPLPWEEMTVDQRREFNEACGAVELYKNQNLAPAPAA